VSGTQETTRQKKFARMIQKEITPLLQPFIQNHPGVLASVPYVRVSADLMVLRIYITTFPDDKVEAVVEELNKNVWEIRKALASGIRNGVRKIPELSFYSDDTVQYVKKIDALFEQIRESDPEKTKEEENRSQEPT